MPPEIATKIDNRYDVLGELGRGGMGVVYKANDTRLDRLVAIKVMTAYAPGRDDHQERFLREAKSIAKIQHPNIVVVYDFGYHAGAPYIAMEYVEGVPLDKVIASRVNLTPLTKVDFIVQVCHALHYAHQLGIIHRDVKPGNIMVLEGGRRVKLLDFGIARAGAPSKLSKSGLAMGTTCYMSPEQTQGKKDLDARADIFSVGVVLYELLSGKPPWTGESDYEVMNKIIHEPAPPLAGLSNCPAALSQVFDLALAKDPNGRYQTAEKMAQALSELEAPLKERALEEALAQFQQGDLLRANDLVSQILRIDTRHREAIELRAKLQQVAQLQQRSEQVRQLRTAAEEAVGQKRYSDALIAVEKAITIDAANTELFHYRELIRNEVKRREDIRKKLELARHAQEMNDLSTAQELVEKVLEADPTDTQARVMKSSLEQERKRQQLQEIADEASRALAVRAFPRVREFLQQMEALDPDFAGLAPLKKALGDGEAAEKRRIELENLIGEVRRILEAGIVPQCLSATEEALARFPGEQRLVRLRGQAEALRDAAAREEAIQKQLALVKTLAEKGQNAKALAAAENALRQLGSEYRLQSLVAELRLVVEREQQAQAEQSALAQANQALQAADFDTALQILTAVRANFPNSQEIADAVQVAQAGLAKKADAAERQRRLQAEQSALAQAQKLIQAGDFEAALKVLSPARANFPNSQEISEAVQAAQAGLAKKADAAERQRKLQAEQSALAQAQKLIQAGDFEAALQILTPARLDFPNSKAIADALQAAQAAVAQKAEVEAQNTRKREIAEALDRALAGESDPDLQVRLAEEAVRRTPGNEAAERSLQRVRQRQAQIVSIVARARQFEAAQRYAESIQEWENVRKLWPQCPNLDAQIARLKAAQNAPAVTPEPPSSTPRFSATAIMTAMPAAAAPAPAPLPQAAPVPVEPAPQAVGPSAAPTIRTEHGLAVETEADRTKQLDEAASLDRITSPDRSRPQLRPADLIQSVLRSKKSLIAIAAAVVVVIGISVLFRAPRTNPKPAAPPLANSNPAPTPKPTLPQPEVGTLTIQSNVDQVDVWIDGDLKGFTPRRTKTITVVPGNHTIMVRKSGYAAAPQAVTITKDHETTLQFTLNKSSEDANQLPADTYLMITTNPGARVRIDREREERRVSGDGNLSIKTTPGQHRIQVSMEGFESRSENITAKAGDRLAVSADLKPIPKPAPVIAVFSGSPSAIQQGQSAQLQWKIQNTTEIRIDHGVGTVQPESSTSVTPTETTTYTLTARGDGGTQIGQVTISVTSLPKPTVTVFAGPDSIQQGKPAKLAWGTQNAEGVTITSDAGPVGSFGPNGEHNVTPSKTTKYTLIANGRGGNSEPQFATVTVEPAPAAIVPSAPPPSIPAPTVGKDPEIQAVLDAIQVRYKEAYETMDLDSIKQVWSPMSKITENALKASFKTTRAIKVYLKCGNPIITGDSARCLCTETLNYNYDSHRQSVGPTSWTFQLEKRAGTWYVVNKH